MTTPQLPAVMAAAPSERAALEQIAALDPELHSEEGYNEWGEADCFRQAQTIARAALSTESPAPAAPSAEPVLWGLQKPDGSVDDGLVGSKADCEYWSRAQGGWLVVPLYLATPAVAPAAAPQEAPSDLTAFDLAVAAELPRVSHVHYDSHDICEHFAGELRKHLASRPPAEKAEPEALVHPAVPPSSSSGPSSGHVAGASEPAWISVDERVPKPHQSVALVDISRHENCDFERCVHAVGYMEEWGGLTSHWSVRGERALTLDAFTHWMPLPEAPAMSNEGSTASNNAGTAGYDLNPVRTALDQTKGEK